MNRRRRIAVSGLLVVTALGLSGCKGATDAEKRLREALHNTEKLSNTFLYKETVHDKAGDHETDVRGLVEDDFRYKARVAADGKPLLDEVVSDDAIAVRFLDPAAIGRFLRKPAKAKQSGSGVGGGSARRRRPTRRAGRRRHARRANRRRPRSWPAGGGSSTRPARRRPSAGPTPTGPSATTRSPTPGPSSPTSTGPSTKRSGSSSSTPSRWSTARTRTRSRRRRTAPA